MCIVCKMRDQSGIESAEAFLSHFDAAQSEMRKASSALLMAAEGCANPEDRKRYRTVQKHMARLRREWAQIEHQREAAARGPTEGEML